MGPVVVIGSPALLPLMVTLAAQDADERQLELTAVAGVDDGVQTAVEVAQPEDHLKEGFGGPQVCIERT